MTFSSTAPMAPSQADTSSLSTAKSRLARETSESDAADLFVHDVNEGLSRDHKRLDCKYLYDRRGSQLFDQICDLPEYYPTRTELGIMQEHSESIARHIGSESVLLEFGSGSSLKTRVLLDHLQQPIAYVPVDISRGHLLATADRLREEHPGLEVRPLVADFTDSIAIPDELADENICVYFPGSTIGNLEQSDAIELLSRIRHLCGEHGGLLIGFDLQKDAGVLTRAYNDSQGVTAAFNLNLLDRINREADGEFDVDQFEHLAVYNTEKGRIEISIRSKCEQEVKVGSNLLQFNRGEEIHTEYSHKYTIAGFQSMAESVGMTSKAVWTDPREWFAVMYLGS